MGFFILNYQTEKLEKKIFWKIDFFYPCFSFAFEIQFSIFLKFTDLLKISKCYLKLQSIKIYNVIKNEKESIIFLKHETHELTNRFLVLAGAFPEPSLITKKAMTLS